MTMDHQKKSFIEPPENCPHWLKIKLWKDLRRLVQKYNIAILKTFFLILYVVEHFFGLYFRYWSNWSQTLCSIIEKNIENFRLQEYCLKNRFFWSLSLETYMKQTVTLWLCYIEDLFFLENNIVWFWNFLDGGSTDSSVGII